MKSKLLPLQHPDTLFLKLALIILAAPLLPYFGYFLPWFLQSTAGDQGQWLLWSFMGVVSLTALPYLYILVKAYQLLRAIDNSTAFSQASVAALRAIAGSAGLISLVYLALSPFSYRMADAQDAPGILVLHLALCFMPMVVSVFAAVLQKLLAQAVSLKEDSEYTI